MRCGILLVVAAIALIVIGIQGVHEAHAFSKPVDITCEQFMKAAPPEGWYRIKGGELEVAESVYMVKTHRSALSDDKSASTESTSSRDSEPQSVGGDSAPIDKVYIPVHDPSTWNEKTHAFPPTNLVIETRDTGILATANELKGLDKQKPEDAGKWIAKNMSRVIMTRDIVGMVQAGISSDSDTRNELSKLHETLAPGYLIVEENKKPSMSAGLGTVFGGILLGIVSLLYWARYLMKWQRRRR